MAEINAAVAKIADHETRLALGGGSSVQYVSKSGNDANSGLSWANAKLSVKAAVLALPTITANAEIYKSGTVNIGPGVFDEDGDIPAQRGILFNGANATAVNDTTIRLKANGNTNLFAYEAAWAAADGYSHGLSFQNVTLDGNVSAQAATTLSASMTNVATTLTVASGAAFPGAAFDILIDDEILGVTAGFGTTGWTVTRGKYGSVAVAHSSAAAVKFAGSVLVMRGGGFNCALRNFNLTHCGGPGIRLDYNAVNFTAFDFNASDCGGPAFAYIPASSASGGMISIYNAQIDDCGLDALYFEGNQSGNCTVVLEAIKTESRVSTTRHNHVVAYKPNRQASDASGFVFSISGLSAFALGGGREAVCYCYNGINQGPTWDLRGVGGKDGYTRAFRTAQNGVDSPGNMISYLNFAGGDTGQGQIGFLQLGYINLSSTEYNPEASFTAPAGSLLHWRDGGDYARLYQKIGTGNTGWSPLACLIPVASLTDGATITWNTTGTSTPNAKVTIAGSRTLALTNTKSGQRGSLIVTQNATGGFTLTLPAGSKASGTPVTTANAVNKYEFLYDGATYFWTITPNLV
jgi:hypothetical protein